VHTGAQKPINEKVNDAQRNVKDALYSLKILFLNGKAESLTVMGGVVLLTIGITKASDFHARAMISPMHRPALRFDELPNPDTYKLPDWLRNVPAKTAAYKPVVYRGPNRIGEFRAEMNEDIESVIAALEHGNRLAFLLVTYGANTYDAGVISEMGAYIKTNGLLTPIFAVSPVNADPHLGTYDVGNAMIRAGVQPLYMTPEAARAKLMLALASIPAPTTSKNSGLILQKTRHRPEEWVKKINAFMSKSLIGEIPNSQNRRDPYSAD